MTDIYSSIESACFLGVKSIIKDMAREGVFTKRGPNSTDRIRPEAVIGRFGKSAPGTTPLPAVLVTYLGHRRDVSAGENDSDNGVVNILVQIVDKIPNEDDPHADSYFTWMSAIRTWLLDGPLESPDPTLGFIWQTHVTDQRPPDEYAWAVSDQAKLMLMVQCFTKTRRSIDKAQA